MTNGSYEINWKDNAIGFMRLAMASMVLLGHAGRLGGFEHGVFDIFGAYGYGTSAVLGFMFLSGMLITRSWENSKGVVDFFSRRFLRIFPGYWVCLLVCVFLFAPLAYSQAHGSMTGFPWSGEESAPMYALRNAYLKMDQDFIRGMYHHEGVNFPLWTILSEFACYFMTIVVGVLALGKRFRPLF